MNTAPVHVVIVTCLLMTSSQPRHLELRFSRTFYNATVPENSVSRTLVTSGDRMGVLRNGDDDDVTFRIVSGDPDRIFKVEDKPVGDFIFLILRMRSGNVVLNRERKDKYVLTVKAFSTRTTIEATTIINVRVLDQNDLSPIFFPSAYNVTIPEDYGLFKSVLKVSAEDADQGVNGEVHYWIREPTEHFNVHPYTGVVTLSKRLKYSERSIHDLTIIAQDRATIFRGGGQLSLASVSVRVKQVNLYGPEIYVYVLQEPTANRLGIVSAVVRVVDRDESVQGQIDDIRIVHGDPSGLFIVDPLGENKNNSRTEYNIILKKSVRLRKTPSVFNLSLLVTDKGFPPRKSYKAVSLRVDSDEVDPRFERDVYEINVPEYLPQGSPLLKLGLLNREHFLSNDLELNISEGNAADTFSIDSRSLVLLTNLPLDHERHKTFTLSVSIYKSNKEILKQASTTKVKINVIDFNDNTPQFYDFPDEVWVSENNPAGTQVVNIAATDADSGMNGYVTYSIANLRSTPFEIDPLSGVLRTNQPLDFENVRRYYTLRIRASDSGSPYRRETERLLQVNVRNVNDNSPVFLKGDCSLSIPTNLPVGVVLFSMSATDLDEMDIVIYNISSTYRNDCIKIHPSSGILSLNCELTDVAKSEWELNVTASDGLHNAETNVRVFVASTDLGSNEIGRVQYSCRDAEAFTDGPNKQFYSNPDDLVDSFDYESSLTILRKNSHDPVIFNLPKTLQMDANLQNRPIYTIIAGDEDDGYAGHLIFSMTLEPNEILFKLDPATGEVSIIDYLHLQDQDKYLLNITVCDQGFPERCAWNALNIELVNITFGKPRFDQDVLKVHIPESSKPGSELVTIRAITDNRKTNITYNLLSDDPHFSIDAKSGTIYLKTMLDREYDPMHSVTVRAITPNWSPDNSESYSIVEVTFFVDDFNDCAPEFINSHHAIHVLEDLPEGSVLFIMHAIDRDSGPSGEIEFFISESSEFSIDSSTGIIRLRGRLDYETRRDYVIRITAADKGQPSLTAETNLVINVVDVNENLYPPVFEDVVVTFSIKENLPAGSLVGEIKATDGDIPGVDSKLVYTITGGDGIGHFEINEQGHLRTTTVLDAEKTDHFWLTVVAEDSGMIPLSASLQVYISVLDDNDHFTLTMEPSYQFSVEEKLPSHSLVYISVLEDEDHLTLTLEPSYQFSVEEKLPSHSPVYISVLDDNDHFPLTLEPSYQFLVQENLPSHSLVGHVTSADGDVASSNVTYFFTHPTTNYPFKVNAHTGQILTTTPLDREVQGFYLLQVVARDSGDPALSSTTAVTVVVGDVNDHTPSWDRPGYTAQLPQIPHHLAQETEVQDVMSYDGEKWSSFNKTVSDKIVPVFHVLASDPDHAENGSVTYSIVADTPFIIHENTGLVYARERLLLGRQYEFQVSARDNGSPYRRSVTAVVLHTPVSQTTLKYVPSSERITVDVSESTKPGYTIARLNSSVEDPSQLSYIVIGGPGMGHVTARGDNLMLSRWLDCEVDTALWVTVRAANNTAYWDMQVTLNIQDVNEFAPEFRKCLYTVNVNESTPVSSILISLEAFDLDCTYDLMYSVSNHQPGSDMFAVDAHTGDLMLTADIDREKSDFHELTVMVSDGGVSPSHGFARVHIHVQDINDNTPEWTTESRSLRLVEDTQPGSHLVTLIAVDRDSNENGVVDYAIVSGNTNSTFKIHPVKGILQLETRLDFLCTPEFLLVVKATDHGVPRRYSLLDVRVTVIPSQKRPPRCLHNQYWVEVSEQMRPGELVGTVKVDTAPSLWYQLVAGDPEGHFNVNPTSGDILLQRPLDYEANNFYNISVSVTNMAGLKTLCSVAVYVLDYNDNPPTTEKSSYEGFVLESAPAGSLVMTDIGPLRILAEDLDSGVNSVVGFTFREGTGGKYLSVDPLTGAVRTNAALDFEQLSELRAQLILTDGGQPRLTCDTAISVLVHVKDVNDCPPSFLEDVYNVTVFFPANKDVLVVKVEANDPDSEAVTSLRYSIVTGNDDQAFTIEADSGAIYVEDPRLELTRRLTVAVFDGVHQAFGTVNIVAKPLESSSLRFQRPLYQAAVLENSTQSYSVAVVNVLGSRLEEDIRFSILNRCPLFAIEGTSGVITAAANLIDREAKDFYEIIVQAYSTERKMLTRTTVNVTVLDANDNCPQFVNQPYRAAVVNNATRGDFVFKVVAKDQDVGDNGEVRYGLDHAGSEMFRINRRSGEVRVKSAALQHRHKVNVTVYATDGGIVPCSTSTTVSVALVDARAPLWERTVYNAQVAESAAVFSVVAVSLKATSVNKVVYQLISSDNFLLRHDTGVLQVYGPLDRETTALHSLTVKATDVVSGLSSDTLLLLEVTDLNDCHPRFLQDGYRVRVEERAEPGTNLTRVTAVDLDTGMNAVVRYSLNHPQFGVDSEDGTLVLRQPLDYERDRLHYLTVLATDGGTVALTSFVTVIVEVVNTNDNAPELPTSPAPFVVSQNAPRGFFVGKITARDADGDRLSYRMVSYVGVAGRAFYVDIRTGIVTVLNPTYFTNQTDFSFDVSVDDGLFSTRGTVSVRVLAQNNHRPRFERDYEVAVAENLPSGRTVLRVTAVDGDTGLYGTVSYRLPPQRDSAFFTIDNSTGEISTTQLLDRESQPHYWLWVEAADAGGARGWARVHVTVTDVNDNRPHFRLPRYYSCVSGDIAADQTVAKAVDADESVGGEVKYSLAEVLPPQARDWFRIHPQEGSVHALRPLMHYEPQTVTLTIRATDGGATPLHSDVTLTLSLGSRDLPSSTLRPHPSRYLVTADTQPGKVLHRFQSSIQEEMEFKLIGGEDYVILNRTGHLILKNIPTSAENSFGLLVSGKNASCIFEEISIISTEQIPFPPIFVEERVEVIVPENIEVGSRIHKVSLKNYEDDGSVTYSLADVVSQFAVDPLSGWLTVRPTPDRQSLQSHQLVVVATVTSSSLTATCLVSVTVTGVNDNPHVFNQEIYNVAVKEDAAVGSAVARLTLVDPDDSPDLVLLYITAGDESLSFNVTEGRELVVARGLDRETQAGYSLTVTATDGTFTAFTTVNVLLIDVNDEPHRCVHSVYNASVSEADTSGHLVTAVQTVDPDLETSLEYRLSGAGADSFTVDGHGEIRLRRYLDREVAQSYLLDVTVTDPAHPSWTCASRVLVDVQDVNDNAPTFAVANETITLTEDATVGMIITKLQVLDYDQGDNRRVQFALSKPSELFSLAADSGLLTLARPLQSSPGSVHYVSVRATDHGEPPLSTPSTLQVIVLGMNDDPPVQVASAYHVAVPEDAPVGTSLVQVRAADEDDHPNWSMIYTVLEGNSHGEFDIEQRTGVLSTRQPLDYEVRQSYRLLVLTTGLGDTSLSGYSYSYTSVNVTVLDVNDNSPVFKVTRYSVQVREDIDVGQMVLKIDADDSDSGRNGEIKFSLDEPSMRSFSIGPFTGVLTVANRLDRESTGRYSVTVRATDQGSPPLSSSATVIIDVTDVNDNPPLFVHPNATTVIQADRMPGWAVFHFAVTDADQTFTSSPFSFVISEGNGQDMFRIDPDGTLRTTDRLKLKLGDLFRLKVRVDDGGSPALHSSTWIYIKVVEPSKHPPVVQPLRVWVGVYGGEYQWPGGDLGQLNATDLDPYDKLEYSVFASPPFAIDTRHGVLKARASLAPGVYSVNVTVTDGKYTAPGVVTVTVVPLSQDMLQSSVYIRLSPWTTQERLVTRLPLFLSTLRSAFLRDVTLISVQDTPNSTIGLLIAVSGGADLNVVQEVLLSSGLQGTTPQCDCRNGGLCQRQLQMMPDRTNVYSAGGLSFVTPGHSLAFYCVCSIGYAGEHCEQIKCLCPPLQVCVPQRVGFVCMPPCSTNQTCPPAMTSSVTWPQLLVCLLVFVAAAAVLVGCLLCRKYKSSSEGDGKYGSWDKHNCYIKKKAKLSNLKASQKLPIFTGSPNNGTVVRNNLEGGLGSVGDGEGEALPLDYLRNINPQAVKTRPDNGTIQGHSSAPDLATCHLVDPCGSEDPARELAALDDRLAQEVVQYGFPPPGGPPPLTQEMEASL